MKWLLWNSAHGMTAMLLWHVQTFVVIWYYTMELNENQFSIEFELWWIKKTFVKWSPDLFNTLRPRQNGRHFPDDIFKCIFLNENVWIPIKISLKFVPKGPINKIPALVQIMAWRRPGDKPLSESRMFILLPFICVTRPQWVENLYFFFSKKIHKRHSMLQ